MIMEIGIKTEYEIFLKSIFEQHSFIDKVVVYGSRAKGNFTDRSDIDLVVFGNPEDRFDLIKVLNEIESSFFSYNVDIQMINDIKNAKLLEHINRIGKIFYEKNK
jgi:uncharacterized protein